MKETKAKLLLYAVTVLVSLVILLDFTLPGKEYTENVIGMKKDLEQYYNAARNYHYSYELKTSKHQFSVTEDFAKSAENKKVVYSVSLMFKEINRYKLLSSDKSNIYSFRIASGLVLPLLVIITILIAYKYNKKMSTLIFVLQVALLANLIYLVQ